MSDIIEIPKLSNEGSVYNDWPVVGSPGWFSVKEFGTGKTLKPLIRCNCGSISGIGLHHVHPDGRITASFYHKKGNKYPEDPKGCEWHVWLKLIDWTGEDLPPDKDKK